MLNTQKYVTANLILYLDDVPGNQDRVSCFAVLDRPQVVRINGEEAALILASYDRFFGAALYASRCGNCLIESHGAGQVFLTGRGDLAGDEINARVRPRVRVGGEFN